MRPATQEGWPKPSSLFKNFVNGSFPLAPDIGVLAETAPVRGRGLDEDHVQVLMGEAPDERIIKNLPLEVGHRGEEIAAVIVLLILVGGGNLLGAIVARVQE